MDRRTQEKITRLQDSLSALRKVAGWSAEELGEILDVTRQTIVNLETGQTKMTKVQYMALRLAFEVEAQASENDTLSKLITILVDSDNLDEVHRDTLKKAISTAANSVGRRAGAAAAGMAAISAVVPLLASSALLACGPIGMVAGTVATGIFGTKSALSLLSDIKNSEKGR